MNRFPDFVCACLIAISLLAGSIILASAFNNIADAITYHGAATEFLGKNIRDGLLNAQ